MKEKQAIASFFRFFRRMPDASIAWPTEDDELKSADD
jgi:hypothetical protein